MASPSTDIEEMRRVYERAKCPQWRKMMLRNGITNQLLKSLTPNYRQMLLDCAEEFAKSTESGSELDYQPSLWSDSYNAERFNCYDYAFNNYQSPQSVKTQPGQLSGKYDYDKRKFRCSYFDRMLKSDHPGIKKTTFSRKCPNGHYKVALIVDSNGKTKDYHFLRQDKKGIWSHKTGNKSPKQTDASDNPIIVPHLADHKYNYFNYSKFCDYYCIKNNSWQDFRRR